MLAETKIPCPLCDKEMLYRGPSPEGKSFRCPSCAQIFRVPVSERAADAGEEADAPRQRMERPAPAREAIAEQHNRPAMRPYRDEEDDQDRYEEREERRPRRRARKSGGGLLIFGLVGGGIFVLLLCSGLAGFAIYKFAAVSWQEFSPPGGNFTATFPGKPKHQQQHAMGQAIEMYVVELRAGQFAYSVAYNELGANAEHVGADLILDGAANGLGGKILNQRKIQINGHPGREVTAEVLQNGVTLVLTDRIYVVKSRMYQVIVAGVKGKEPPAPYAQFLDSFRVKE